MKKGGASCGLGFNSVPDIQSSLQVATANGYDFMVSFFLFTNIFVKMISPKFLENGFHEKKRYKTISQCSFPLKLHKNRRQAIRNLIFLLVLYFYFH